VARKFDEFRPDEGENLKVRCDNFAYYLKEEVGARGYIIFYRGGRRPYNGYHLLARDYMANAWRSLTNKIEPVFGGYRELNTMELWIVPEGAQPPKATPTYVPKRKSKRRALHRWTRITTACTRRPATGPLMNLE
jgi:hypothetical protein